MELHRLAVILLVLPLCGFGASLRRIPLDEAKAVTITLATDAPTTCRVPGAIAGIEVANVSAKAEDRPPVLLSHQTGTAFFSVRALSADAKAAANVIYGRNVYVLNFVTGAEPDRSVEFVNENPARGIDPKLLMHTDPKSLVERAKAWSLLKTQQPEVAKEIGYATPKTLTEYRGFCAWVEEVWRFGREDALVFRLRIQNRTQGKLRIDTSALAIRVGRVVVPVKVVDGPGEVASRGTLEIWATCIGEEKSAGISVENEFRVLVPRAA